MFLSIPRLFSRCRGPKSRVKLDGGHSRICLPGSATGSYADKISSYASTTLSLVSRFFIFSRAIRIEEPLIRV